MPRGPWLRSALAIALTVGLVLAVMVPGLGRYGLWEPWEVDRLDEATTPVEEGEEPEIGTDGEWARGPLVRRLDAMGYHDGAEESAVRRPSALLAAFGLLVALGLGAALFGVRTGVYSTLVLAGLPLTLVASRLVVWSPAPGLATTLVLGGAALALFGPLPRWPRLALGLGLLGAGVAVGVSSAGALMGAGVPLAGAALGLAFARAWREGAAGWVALVLVALLALGGLAVGLVPLLDEAYRTTGVTGEGPTFDVYLRALLHGCFPWTGLLVAGLGCLASPTADAEDRKARAAVVLATGLAGVFAGQSLFSRLGGEAPFLALWPLAVGAGLLLERAETEETTRKVAALVVGLFMALGLRDALLEPGVVLVPLADSHATVPEGWGAARWFAAMTLLAAAPTVLALAMGAGRRAGAPFREWAVRWLGWLSPKGRHWAHWLGLAVPALLLVHAVLAAAAPEALWFPFMACIERRVWIGAGLLVPVGVVLALGGKLAWEAAGRLGAARVWTVGAAAAAVALAGAHVGLPSLSRHMSSRGVVQAYERMSRRGEPLLAYRASTRAVELLGSTEIEQVPSLEGLAERLAGPGRSFGLIKRDDLSRLDIRYRKQTGRHVPVVDDSSAKLLLLASRLGQGQKSVNPLDRVVPLERPRPSTAVHANFDDRIELFGIDVEGPGGREWVCPLEEFTVRYYYECLRPVAGSYKIFVHVDGYGQRINGDHEPADGLYLVRDWQEGDFVVDEQRLKVPGHYRPGDYTIYVGFFQGSKRLPVRDGPATRDDRVNAGVLRVR